MGEILCGTAILLGGTAVRCGIDHGSDQGTVQRRANDVFEHRTRRFWLRTVMRVMCGKRAVDSVCARAINIELVEPLACIGSIRNPTLGCAGVWLNGRVSKIADAWIARMRHPRACDHSSLMARWRASLESRISLGGGCA